MAKKLNGLVVKKIDFVDSGANPEANVMIYKRKEAKSKQDDDEDMDINLEDEENYDDEDDEEEDDDMDIDLEDEYEDEDDEEEAAPPKKGVKKALHEIAKALGFVEPNYEPAEFTKGEKPMTDIYKKAYQFSVLSEDASPDDVVSAVRMNSFGMSESMASIVSDDTIGINKRAEMIANLDDYYTITKSLIPLWANGQVSTQVAKRVDEVNPAYQEVFKSASAWLEEQIEKSETNNEEEDESEMEINKKSAQDIYKGLNPAVRQEIEDLKKFKARKEDEEMLEIAKRYETIGKKADEFAPVLKSLKATNEQVYHDTLATLDAAVSAVEKSGMFKEVGSGMSGKAGEGWSVIEKSANKILEANPNMSRAQAIVKAGEQNPEALAEYEATLR